MLAFAEFLQDYFIIPVGMLILYYGLGLNSILNISNLLKVKWAIISTN